MDFLDSLPFKFDTEAFLEDYLIPWGTNIAFAIVILLVGRILSKWIVNFVRKGLGKSRLDSMLVNFVTAILGWILILLVLVAALDRLGVDTTSFIALLGAAGLAIGLALKDSLQNFASGVMLILFRPFTTGDLVEAAGVEGVVEEIRIFSTKMRTPDNREVTVPNGDIFSGVIINNNARETRRIDLVIGIGYDDNLETAKNTLTRVIEAEERVLSDPKPMVAVGELGASSVDILVRPWVKTADYLETKCALTEKFKLALDEAGVSLPYPKMDVHLDQSEAA